MAGHLNWHLNQRWCMLMAGPAAIVVKTCKLYFVMGCKLSEDFGMFFKRILIIVYFLHKGVISKLTKLSVCNRIRIFIMLALSFFCFFPHGVINRMHYLKYMLYVYE